MKALLKLTLFPLSLIIIGVIADHYKVASSGEIITAALSMSFLVLRGIVPEKKP